MMHQWQYGRCPWCNSCPQCGRPYHIPYWTWTTTSNSNPTINMLANPCDCSKPLPPEETKS